MKKIIVLCSVIVCLAVIITAFSACNSNSGNENTTNPQESVVIPSAVNGELLFTAEVGKDNVVIKNNGTEYQILKYPQNSGVPFDVNYAKSHAEFIDLNFDGEPDFYIATAAEGDTIYYFCWLYNATTKQFDFSVSLSGLTNISVDHDNHIIYSTIKNGESTRIVSYSWVNGQLAYKEVFDDVSDTIPVEVTQSASNNALGSNKPTVNEDANDNVDEDTAEKPTKNNSTNSDKPTKNDSAQNGDNKTTTKKDKPLNTTTTTPANHGIEVVTGDIDDGWF